MPGHTGTASSEGSQSEKKIKNLPCLSSYHCHEETFSGFPEPCRFMEWNSRQITPQTESFLLTNKLPAKTLGHRRLDSVRLLWFDHDGTMQQETSTQETTASLTDSQNRVKPCHRVFCYKFKKRSLHNKKAKIRSGNCLFQESNAHSWPDWSIITPTDFPNFCKPLPAREKM